MHVILVHGTGLDHHSFDPVARRLTTAGVGVTALPRRGYDGRPPAARLDTHVDDLAATVETLGDEHVVVAGVSGGATLSLALATRSLPPHVTVVAHEPLLGPLSGEQYRRISASVDALMADHRAAGVDAFIERLVTPGTWRALDAAARARCRARGSAVRIEAPGFARFPVGPEDLATAAGRLTWTVGQRSPCWRHETAQIAARFGVRVRRVEAAHTPQIEDPDGWIATILDTETTT